MVDLFSYNVWTHYRNRKAQSHFQSISKNWLHHYSIVLIIKSLMWFSSTILHHWSDSVFCDKEIVVNWGFLQPGCVCLEHLCCGLRIICVRGCICPCVCVCMYLMWCNEFRVGTTVRTTEGATWLCCHGVQVVVQLVVHWWAADWALSSVCLPSSLFVS